MGTGLGVSGGASGSEIDIGQSLRVGFPAPRTVTKIEVLFLFNGPEFNDKAEVAKVTTDQASYKLTMPTGVDNGIPVWSDSNGAAISGALVERCVINSTTNATSTGPGCFRINNPFPAPVSSMTFEALPGTAWANGGTNTNDSDYSIGRIEAYEGVYGVRTSFKTGRAYVSNRNVGAVLALIPDSPAFTKLVNVKYPDSTGTLQDLTLSTLPNRPDGLTVAPGNSVDLADCRTTTPCTVIPGATGEPPAVTFDQVKLANDSPTGVTVYQIRGLIDCRYAPVDCSNLLGVSPIGTAPFDNNEYVEGLIGAGIIIPLDPSKPSLAKNRYRPAAQLLNVTPMLPEDVTSLFSESGGLPDLQISRTYRAQRGRSARPFRFDALFYKTAKGQVFVDTLFTDIEVNQLSSTTSSVATLTIGQLLIPLLTRPSQG